MKWFGYLVAIEADALVNPEWVEQALQQELAIQSDGCSIRKIEVESMGEIDCYEG